MITKRQKANLTIVTVLLILLSIFGAVFVIACYMAVPATIHTTSILDSLSNEDRIFIYAAMRQQVLTVSIVLGSVAVLWAAVAAFSMRLWIRCSNLDETRKS